MGLWGALWVVVGGCVAVCAVRLSGGVCGVRVGGVLLVGGRCLDVVAGGFWGGFAGRSSGWAGGLAGGRRA